MFFDIRGYFEISVFELLRVDLLINSKLVLFNMVHVKKKQQQQKKKNAKSACLFSVARPVFITHHYWTLINMSYVMQSFR